MSPEDLLRECRMAHASGLDFPKAWRNVIRIHPLVAGPAVQMADRGRVWLEVPLVTGHRIAYESKTGFTLIPPVENLALASQ
ncbi:MAG TPA: hypothetical protein VMB81_12095 [Candidatus Sulfotelmatobacter sp.]|nr:hypothetical protein [Candidatus Sulfotelmatobacter sp.]